MSAIPPVVILGQDALTSVCSHGATVFTASPPLREKHPPKQIVKYLQKMIFESENKNVKHLGCTKAKSKVQKG